MDPQLLFALSFPLAAPFWALMIVAPRWSVTRRVIASPLIVVPALLVYAVAVLPALSDVLPAVASPTLVGHRRPPGQPARRCGGVGALHRVRPVRGPLDLPRRPRARHPPPGHRAGARADDPARPARAAGPPRGARGPSAVRRRRAVLTGRRQPRHHPQPTAVRGLQAERSAGQLDGARRDRQPQPRPVDVALRRAAPEAVRGPLQLVGPRPGPVSRTAISTRPSLRTVCTVIVPPGEENFTALSSTASSTVSTAPTGAATVRPRLPVALQPQAGVLGQRPPGLHPVAHRGVDVHVGERRTALGPGQREQLVEQRGEPLGLLQRRAVVVGRRPRRRAPAGSTGAVAARSAGCAAGGSRRPRTPAARPARPSRSRPCGRTTRRAGAAQAGRCRRPRARPRRPRARPTRPGRCPRRAGAPGAGSSARRAGRRARPARAPAAPRPRSAPTSPAGARAAPRSATP